MTSEVPFDISLHAMTSTPSTTATAAAATTTTTALISCHNATLKARGGGALTDASVHSDEEDGANSADFMSCEKTASVSFDDNKTLEEEDSSSSSSSHTGEDGGNDQRHSSASASSIFRSSPAPAQRASLTYLESSPSHRYKAHHKDDDDDKVHGAESLRYSSSSSSSSNNNNTASTCNRNGNGNSDGIFSPSQQTSLAAYKTTVHQVMQRMEQSQIRLLEQQDAKSRAFRRRMDELLMYGGSSGSGGGGGGSGGGGGGGEKNQKMTCDGNVTVATAVSTLYQDGLAARGSHDSSDGGTDQEECYHSQHHHPPSSVVIGELPFVGGDPPAASSSSWSKQKQSTLEPTATTIVSSISSSSSSYTSIFDLQKEVKKLRTGFADLQVENDALRALRSSYQNRLARETGHRENLERQITQLQDKVDEWQDKYQSQHDLVKHLTNQCRDQRMVTLSQEATLQHKNLRVRRDLDKLWKKYKASQKHNEVSQQTVTEMEQRLEQLERKEVKWQKERSFMKDKMQFMKDKTTKLNKSLQESKEAQNKAEAELAKLILKGI